MLKSMKARSVDCYLNRELNLCITFVDFNEKLLKITKTLLKNQYPEQFIRTRINDFLENHKVNILTRAKHRYR